MSNENKDIVQSGGKVPVITESASLIQVIERIAMNPEADIEKMKELMAMKERLDDREAEKTFNIAMSKAQSKIGRITTDKYNKQTRSQYASYAALDRVIRPAYIKEGFSLSFNTGEALDPEAVRVFCYVSHKFGHTRTYHIDMDASGKGAKGGDVMTKTHAAGSAMRYGMRYLLTLVFNIAIGEDDDGNAATAPAPVLITEEQANYLHAKITDNDLGMVSFMAWLNDDLKCEKLSDLFVSNFALVERRINSAIKAKQQKGAMA